jgi:DNA-binding CsgD family transcriptional regulator
VTKIGANQDPATATWAIESVAPHAALEYLGSVEHAIFLCDHQTLAVRWMNGSAQALVESDGPSALLSNRLYVSNKADFAVVEKLLPFEMKSFVLFDIDSKPAYIGGARRFGEDDNYSSVAVTLFRFNENERCILPDLRLALGITPTEQKVLISMASGLRADAIAKELNVTIETVRTHIRRVYAKTGAASREEILRMVNKLTVPVL